MTNQEVFDKVATHLATQGRKAVDLETGYCCYRAPDGTMCAIGCLIPDDKYSETIERRLAGAVIPGLGLDLDPSLCRDLQRRVHDLHAPHAWDEQLRRVADRYGLDTAIIDKLTWPEAPVDKDEDE